MDIKRFGEYLEKEEGRRHRLYQDTKGKWTIGVGFNLTDVGLDNTEIDFILMNRMLRATRELDRQLPWWRGMDEVRQLVLADLCYNMGIESLKGFVHMLAALQRSDYKAAAQELEDSEWFSEVGRRGPKLVHIMETGNDA